ncbi:MAG: 2-aminoethylphosphonate--pyruvate transaminase [Chitinophagales bacterium]|nr:2-aminoethylphosphonate--pyruvate transaminase [Chitinophagales bacterium]
MKKDKLLFTPGPLTTSATVKEAMLRDLGSRDFEFIQTVQFVREKLLAVGEVSKSEGYEAVIMQGSGTFGIESVISSVIPASGHLLIVVNGVYGERISTMAKVHGIQQTKLMFDENEVPDVSKIEAAIDADKSITHLAVIHCETTTGIINPIEAIGDLCSAKGICYIVDAMSSFGAVPLNVKKTKIDFLISSSNKCIEGVPGFSFIIARKESLLTCEGQARSLSLDLFAQWKGLEADGQFRFTPPTHSLLAFAQALRELEEEGSVIGRAQRYKSNFETLLRGMKALGFKEYLEEEKRGYIITCFHYPEHPNFDFKKFYEFLNEKGFVIYPGKLSRVNCFRIGNIGRITTTDVQQLLEAIRVTLAEMGILLVVEGRV